MKRLSFAIAAVWAATCAYAGMDPVRVGDNIRFFDRPGSPGGEYGVRNNTLGIGTSGSPAWITFCVQRSEFLDFHADGFDVIDISDEIVVGSGSLASGTALLYTAFRHGNLATELGYDGSANHANALQNAIWKFQGQANNVDNDATPNLAGIYYNWAVSNQTNFGPGIGNVRVANIVWATDRYAPAGTHAQDVLILIPSPGAALLGVLGTSLIALRRRI